MNKRGNIMEFIFAYGWAILAVLVTIVSLALFMSGRISCFMPSISSDFDKVSLLYPFFTGSDSTKTPNKFLFTLQSKTDEDFLITGITLLNDGNVCWQSANTYSLSRNGKTKISGIQDTSCVQKSGTCDKYDVRLSYRKTAGGLTRVETAKLFVNLEDFQDLLYSITSWSGTDFGSGNVMKSDNNNLIGSYEGSCGPVLPSDVVFNQTITSTVYWNLPGSCSSGVSGVGFDSAYCSKNANYLAHGWLKVGVMVHPLFEGHNLTLTGGAQYQYNGDTYNDGICVNDNMYFYVNDQLIFKGGTTGTHDGDNILEAGEEALRSCDGCYDIDSSGWCIPPVTITDTSAFNFNGDNRILILLEDFCISGGVKPFIFSFE
jgi:hypothetical protein